MSNKGSKNNKSSLFTRFKKHVSSVVSPSPPASPRPHSPLPSGSTGRQDAPGHYADTHLTSASLSHHPSASSFSAHSTTNSMPAHPSPSHQHLAQHLEDSVRQNSAFTHLAPPYPQGQASTSQGQSGILMGAHDFIMKDSVFINHNATSDTFMEKLLQHTIIGAEFDSSDRVPPPRCHPGTRLAIIQRCLDFIVKCQEEGKLRWIFGPAGVGKSAVMQMITEKAPDGVIFASIFFSVNGRRDGTKVVLTIAYQLAVKHERYRQFVRDQISLDPSLLRKSLSVQFNKFIVEPFMLNRLFDPSCRFLIAIDGLDECDESSIQEELLKLITDFCITYPTSPIAWIVASRPEPHITSFFDQKEVRKAYTKEEIEINSDEAREEVELYLRDGLKKIQLKYPTLRRKREWPLEHEFTKIASTAGGLFAYADTVVRYIDDPQYRDPAAQLRRVLETIDAGKKDHTAGMDHPMAQLDALYKRILSNVPASTMINTRKLLAVCLLNVRRRLKFRLVCNMLGLTEDDAYGAICHLHAVMKIPEPSKADDESLSYYHKSFQDFLLDSTRSGFSDNFPVETVRLMVSTSLRIAEEASYNSNDVAEHGDIRLDFGGSVKGHCDNIALSWPCDEHFQMTDGNLRINLYREIMLRMLVNFPSHDVPCGSVSVFQILTTRFSVVMGGFPFRAIRDSAFDKFRHELTETGQLKQVPLRTFGYATVATPIDLLFTSPIGIDVKLSDPSQPRCEYRKEEVGQRQCWSTKFEMYYRRNSLPESEEETMDVLATFTRPPQQSFTEQNLPEGYQPVFVQRDPGLNGCIHCSLRFAHHFTNNQDILATVFVDKAQMYYVEFSFLDPDDGVSEWRYRFCHPGPLTSIDS